MIRVRPTIIAGDGVPNFGGNLDQDFALVVTNGNETAVPVLTVDEYERPRGGRDGSSSERDERCVCASRRNGEDNRDRYK